MLTMNIYVKLNICIVILHIHCPVWTICVTYIKVFFV